MSVAGTSGWQLSVSANGASEQGLSVQTASGNWDELTELARVVELSSGGSERRDIAFSYGATTLPAADAPIGLITYTLVQP